VSTPVVWFADRDLGKQFPRILVEAGLKVERHADLFVATGSDVEWLRYCGEHGRVALTHNSRIRYVPNELEAVRRFNVRLVVVVGKVPTAALAHNFVRTRHLVESLLVQRVPPLILKVYMASPGVRTVASAPGRVDVWYPKA
jgi:PIN like domain